MATLNKDLLDATTRRAMNRASDIMRQMGKPLLIPEMALLALLRMPESTAYRAIARLAESRGFKPADLERETETQARTREGRSAKFDYVTDQNATATLSDEMLIALDEARAIALANGEIYIGTEHLLGALSQTGVSTAGLLQRKGVTPSALAALMLEGVVSKRTTTMDWVEEAKRGRLAPLFPREKLLQELVSVLSLARGRNAFLVGMPGSGRRSLAQSLAFLVAEGKGPPKLERIIEVSESAWLDNPQLAMQVALRQAEGGALFIANIHRFFGRAETNAQMSAMKDLQKALIEGACAVIGTTTEAEYNERIRPNAPVAANSHVLRVPPATPDECVQMLALHKPEFERDYGFVVDDGAIKAATTLAARYIGATPLPGAAVQVLHRACAVVKGSGVGSRESRDSTPDYQLTTPIIDAEDVTYAVSMMTGIPVTKLSEDERAKYAQMVQALQKRVIGQDDAILAVSRAVKSARVGLKDPKRPIGSFLFLGPSGVGKTELAKALAEFLFGSEDNLIALDMTEYQKDDTINRLIGSPPGYVGYESGGQLTEKILKSPYAVVLFDEVEKAHPRILDILLQVMEEGRLTDGRGRVANFAETVIILTSNLGAQYLNDPTLGERARELAMLDVRAFFRPEFLNRLDEIVMFKLLTPDVMAKILDLMIAREAKLASSQGIVLEVTPAARAWLLAQNNEPGMGARPLRRILQRNVREKLADYLLTLSTPPTRVVVDANDQGLVYRSEDTPDRAHSAAISPASSGG
ncbi:MAG: ATP-dependent Clp protease ATP-binding subunit [Anaerolineae bacterium]|nr:ATP-dependent Clp protease ATP-binding subunit [Candidatus Roseilinea sp.]MDW8449241.1 ATP-dependent Clp protease ATP-binding subunit [Anaerolineae bacterium]